MLSVKELVCPNTLGKYGILCFIKKTRFTKATTYLALLLGSFVYCSLSCEKVSFRQVRTAKSQISLRVRVDLIQAPNSRPAASLNTVEFIDVKQGSDQTMWICSLIKRSPIYFFFFSMARLHTTVCLLCAKLRHFSAIGKAIFQHDNRTLSIFILHTWPLQFLVIYRFSLNIGVK